ncbi:MAG TPA: cysteine desulfurase family protein [Thermotogota bacterium]|nr:cysteine desulfurase family protein [Thermotogota bacterium]
MNTEIMEVYMDHSATTPVFPEVARVVYELMTRSFGNASSLHFKGQQAKEALDKAREDMSLALGCEPEELVFCSGGTEADNLALFGTLPENRSRGLLTTGIEHEAVLETAHHLEKEGFPVFYAPVDAYGQVDLQAFEKLLSGPVSLVSIMMANNEVGTIQPIAQMAQMAHERGILVHSDAVQAIGKVPINVKELGVDLLSGAAHKFYGPKGVGFLYVKRGTPIHPVVFGGGHERGLRSGTENVPGIVGMARALSICLQHMKQNTQRYRMWTTRILKACEQLGEFRANGHPEQRIPGTLSLSFRDVNGESLMEWLSFNGIAVSTASACQSHAARRSISHVLQQLGLERPFANGTIRVALGHDNDDEQVQYFISRLEEGVRRLRSMNHGA